MEYCIAINIVNEFNAHLRNKGIALEVIRYIYPNMSKESIIYLHMLSGL